MTMTTEKYRIALDTQREMVRRGWHPAAAGAIVRRALSSVAASGMGCGGSCADCCCCSEGGMGRMQMRSLRRDLDPSIKPRQIIAGEQCVRIAETPGNETAIYQQLSDYRSRGWNVMQVESTKGFPSVSVYWACPPGRVPMEAQPQVMKSTMFGAGLSATADVLSQISSAGADPTVSAARDIVGKWSWLIPVFGVLSSAKQKLTSWRGSKTDPTYSIAKGMRRR